MYATHACVQCVLLLCTKTFRGGAHGGHLPSSVAKEVHFVTQHHRVSSVGAAKEGAGREHGRASSFKIYPNIPDPSTHYQSPTQRVIPATQPMRGSHSATIIDFQVTDVLVSHPLLSQVSVESEAFDLQQEVRPPGCCCYAPGRQLKHKKQVHKGCMKCPTVRADTY